MATEKKYIVTLSYERLKKKFTFEVFKKNKQAAIDHIAKVSNDWWGNIHGEVTITAILQKGN